MAGAVGAGSRPGGPPPRVLRISQLDAFELDDALEQLLWSQFARCFRHFKPGLLTRAEPELKVLLQLLVWRFSVYSEGATVGQKLLNIRYHNALVPGQKYRAMSRGQRVCCALLAVSERWLKERCHGFFLSHSGSRRALAPLGGLVRAASLVNFLMFLRRGSFPTLTERFLGVVPVFARPQRPREVNFHFLNRELLWHGFAQFIIFLLPLLNVWKLKAKTSGLPWSSRGPRGPEESSGVPECAVCAEWPVMPHTVGCGHVFCYYCVRSRTAADAFFSCPRCGSEVTGVRPVEPRIETTEVRQT